MSGRAVALLVLTLAVGPQARADLRFERTTVRLDEVRSGVPLAQAFPFVNEGPGPAELAGVRASCGCLTPRLERRTLQPGEQGSVTLEVNTLGQPAGPHTWRLHLQYRAGGELREVPLEVSARVVTEVSVQPAALTLFVEGTVNQDLVLTDVRDRPLSLTAVRASSEHLRASVGQRTRDAQGRWVTRIQLQAAGDFPEGRHEEVLSLYSDDALYGHLKVSVTVVKAGRGRLTAAPAEVSARAAPGQPFPAQLIRVRDLRDEAVEVESVTADDPAVQCRWAAGPDNLATVRVQIDHARPGGSGLRSAIHIHVARPVRQTLTLPVVSVVE